MAQGYPKTQSDRRKKRIFHFEEMWTREESSGEVIGEAWEGNGDVVSKLNKTSSALSRWSRENFGSFAKEMRACRKQMQDLMEEPQTEEVLAKARTIDRRMDELENREELYWKQRSRQEWLMIGDKNTSFFHQKAKQRREVNSIKRIYDQAGIYFDEEGQISEVFASFFESLFTAGQGVDPDWKETLIQQLLPEHAARDIMRIPLPRHSMEDGWTWHPSKRGDFSVRSAYFLAMEERKRGRASTSSEPTRDVWKKVWQLHLPPKIKIFAWKIMHDSVQTKLNLLKRGMGNVDPICPMCGECEESMVHCFFECTEAVVLWRVSSLRLDPSPFQGTSLARRIVDMSSLFSDPKWWNTFWSVMWGIWLRRNAWLFSGKRWRLVDVADKAMSIVGEFEITKQPRQSGNNSATAAAH
ncbi:hypothetical protein RDABS01_037293 [Bienertia sinuspersici]